MKKLIEYINSDLYRCVGKAGVTKVVKCFLFNPGFKYMVAFRCYKSSLDNPLMKYTVGILFRLIYFYYTYKLGISIPIATNLGFGLKINHFSGIIINGESCLGNNITISNTVTIGRADRGNKSGCPIIGNGVYIGPGAKIFGSIKIGDNVAIGANAVVLEDVPPNSVVAGVPAKIVSSKGAKGYLKNEWEQENG